MLVQVQSVVFGKELHALLPRGVEDALFSRPNRWAIFELGDEYAVGTPIEYLDYSEYGAPPEEWDYDRPLPKPAGTWKYIFARFPTHEQAKGFFEMLNSFSEEGISTFYSYYYDGETGEYNLPDELEWELDQERLKAIEDSLPLEQSVASA